MAASMMATFLKAGVSVTAVVSRDLERARQFARTFSIPVSGSSLGSLIDRGDVDAVYVANSVHEHAKVCIAALEAGKPVLCEKPLATSLAEGLRVVEAARKAEILCMEGLWTLFLPAYKQFLELSGSGEWGKTRSLIADFGYPTSEESKRKEMGGVLLDRGVYLIALALSVLGPVERVDALLGLTSAGADEEAFLQLFHSNGAHSQLAVSFAGLMSNTATLSCSRGSIRLEWPLIGSEKISTIRAAPLRSSRDSAQRQSVRDTIMKKLRESPRLRRINRTIKTPDRRYLPFGTDQYLPELNHFLGLMKMKSKESEIASLQLSLDIQRIIERAVANHMGLPQQELRS